MDTALRVYWSDRLEELADRLFAEWERMPVKDPFSRICVVVGDLSTRNWLQRHFLLHRKPGVRRVLANIDFNPLAEFVNDWLAAETHGKDGAHRRPAEHPYSKGVRRRPQGRGGKSRPRRSAGLRRAREQPGRRQAALRARLAPRRAFRRLSGEPLPDAGRLGGGEDAVRR